MDRLVRVGLLSQSLVPTARRSACHPRHRSPSGTLEPPRLVPAQGRAAQSMSGTIRIASAASRASSMSSPSSWTVIDEAAALTEATRSFAPMTIPRSWSIGAGQVSGRRLTHLEFRPDRASCRAAGRIAVCPWASGIGSPCGPGSDAESGIHRLEHEIGDRMLSRSPHRGLWSARRLDEVSLGMRWRRTVSTAICRPASVR